MKENFKDGKNPQDKGDSARHGIPKKATIAQLKKIRSSSTASKHKKQLAHWQINMRSGKKVNENVREEAPANSIASGGVDMAPTMGPRKRKKKQIGYETIDVTDRRYRKDRAPVLRRFKTFMKK